MDAAYYRHDINNKEWALLEPHLPGQRDQWGGIAQDNYVYLDLDDTELLQTEKGCLQHSPFYPAVHPDIHHVPISIFFGQVLSLAPFLYYVQHRI